MTKSSRTLISLACILLTYAIVGTLFDWPANELCASLAVALFVLSFIRNIVGIVVKKKTQGNNNW